MAHTHGLILSWLPSQGLCLLVQSPTACFLLTTVTGLGLGSTFLKCPKGYNKLHRVNDHTGQGLVLTAPRGLWETLKMLLSGAVLSINTSPTVNLPAHQSCSLPKALGKVVWAPHIRVEQVRETLPARSGTDQFFPQDSRSCLWAQFPL